MSRRRSSHLHKGSFGRARGRSSSWGLGRWIVIGAIAVMSSLAQQAHGAGNNAAADSGTSGVAAPSEAYLRRFVRECSTYCSAGVGGLDLWLSLGEECFYSRPGLTYRQQQQLAGGNALTNSDSDSYGTRQTGIRRWRWWWSSVYPVVVCAIVTTAGLFGGFRLGSRLASVPKAARHTLL